jgi:putative membrane protein
MPTLAHVGGPVLEPLQIAPLVLVVAAYYKRAATLRARGRPISRARQVSFGAGAWLIFAALASPLGHVGGELLWAHMAQHLVIGDIAALLVVLGLTGPAIQPVLGLPVLRHLRALAHPGIALPLWIANLYVWHLPALYQGALHSEALHALQHVLFLGCGVAMWMALLGPLPKPRWFGNAASLGYVVAVRLAGTLLANFFMWSGTVFYPDYRAGEAGFDISPLADQGAAGVIMMIEGSLLTVGLFAWLFLRTARESDERQDLLDYAERHGLALDEARAARAVASGRGAELRERLARPEAG